jgi:seryl-tRNA synthetase
MLDIAFIREHRELLQRTADGKNIPLSIQELLELDEKRRESLREIERLRHERNRLSERIGQLIGKGERQAAESVKREVKLTNDALAVLEAEYARIASDFQAMMLLVPNPVSPDTPDGKSDKENVEIRREGEPPAFDFKPRDHVELGEMLGIIDIPRGVKIGGTRNYVLKGAGFRLHRAVQHLAMDVLEQKGFTPMDVPMLVRDDAFVHSGFFPLGREQIFELPEDGKYLIGTSEVSLVSYFSGEIIDVSEPVRLAAATACFRREIGSAGRDVHGLYRVHQFSKVEQVVFCKNDPELSERLLQDITRNAEEIVQLLELPYRVMSVCIGDMGQKTYKQYDIEVWMPGRQAYGETHSSSNLHDFQARRANIRYRNEAGQLAFCHTLNNTAIASPRILIPLLENHQRADGSVYIPKALRPYMGGIEEIQPSVAPKR